MDTQAIRPDGGSGGNPGGIDFAALADFRPLKPEELPFLLDSWTRSYQRSPWAGVVPNHRYPEMMREMIAGLLGRGMVVLVAAEPESGRIMGYVAYEVKGAEQTTAVLHFIYVKDPYRKLGLARALRAKVPGVRFVTHRTRASRALEGNATFAPEIARRKDL